jgi:hypothetical protein
VEATLRKVYQACERAEMLGRRQTSNPTRAHLLQTLFLFVERDEQRVQMQVARILLAVSVASIFYKCFLLLIARILLHYALTFKLRVHFDVNLD